MTYLSKESKTTLSMWCFQLARTSTCTKTLKIKLEVDYINIALEVFCDPRGHLLLGEYSRPPPSLRHDDSYLFKAQISTSPIRFSFDMKENNALKWIWSSLEMISSFVRIKRLLFLDLHYEIGFYIQVVDQNKCGW